MLVLILVLVVGGAATYFYMRRLVDRSPSIVGGAYDKKMQEINNDKMGAPMTTFSPLVSTEEREKTQKIFDDFTKNTLIK